MTASPRGLARSLVVAWLAVLLAAAQPALAWNAAGHRIVALIAWIQLDETTRASLSALLREHPDFEHWLASGNDPDEDRRAFVEASTWADDIRKDSRFYTTGLDQPTATQPGFPDMERRANWHYVDPPLADASHRVPGAGQLDRQLPELIAILGNRRADRALRAYSLPWLIHLVADAHQPLHTASRLTPGGESDSGGNAMMIHNPFSTRQPSTSLHRYWDDLPGPPWLRDRQIESTVTALLSRHPQPPTPAGPAQWIAESRQIAGQFAYPDEELGAAVATISREFHERSVAIANRRVTEAGYRLAELLKALVGDLPSSSGRPARSRPSTEVSRETAADGARANAGPSPAAGQRARRSADAY
ncbi:S1/P1 nuclease [Accumulibacter sp.]|uniref:S1/P1 nuclease n=1 Tax=Accumulibacter sp. TaxID=2053492 RepID=UPI0025CFCB8C|nr:S1/P1 nuclease [Accumulibacter sp.]MCM8594676.1 S1/P1 nuclease [Accumulibacter sp.]MCM8625908.1 S1/P1 nuclease [Accumulibacter sp.]MDS4048822.1 S1/P1 nuclease [Accumulibacter sp.]